MSKIPLFFYDYMEYQLPSKARFHNGHEFVFEDTAEFAMKSFKNKPKLFMRTDATHSGKLINKRVYPGIHMRNSVHTWLDSYAKPVLDEHPEIPSQLNPIPREPKVVGRVATAKFIPLVADAILERDFENPEMDPAAHGSGYTELGCGISDPAAIEEIADGRKITVSVGAVPDKVICSVCHLDLKAVGPCEHEPGQEYALDTQNVSGKILAYLVSGRLEYHHLAFTWRPADIMATVASMEFQDSYNTWNYLQESPIKESRQLLGFRFVDTESGAFLDMDLTQLAQPTIKISDESRPEVISLRDAVLDSKDQEDSMPNNSPEDVQDAGAVDKTEVTNSEPVTKDDVLDTHGAWSQPDPMDGHTHHPVALDEEGNGKTSMSVATDKMPAHDHEIRNGRVLPKSEGEGDESYVSRHPGTWWYDTKEDGTKELRLDVRKDDPADGEPLPELAKVEVENETINIVDAKDDDKALDYSDSEANPEGVQAMAEVELSDHENLMDWYATHTDDQDLMDAKLTTKTRKALPDSAFCGPDRSFPAHDKAHVRNALARLGQGFPKGASASTKAAIRACVLRKAKKMGVEVSDSIQDAETAAFSDPNTQATTLRTLAAQIDNLQSENRRLTVEVRDVQTQRDQYKTQTDEMQEKHREQIVERIVDLEFATAKKNVKDYRTEEALKSHKDELLARELASLSDTASDLQKELVMGDSAGTHPSLASATPEIPVAGLGDSPAAKKEEVPKSNDAASEYKKETLAVFAMKAEEN